MRSPTAEHGGLAEHRQAHQPSATATDSGPVWEAFRATNAYKSLMTEFLSIQRGLCCYCEQSLVDADGRRNVLDSHVEHVLPKAGANGRTLDWTNLMVGCQGGTWSHHKDPTRYLEPADENASCGHAKGQDLLGAGCDPRTFPFARLTSVDTEGRISANAAACATVNVSGADLERTLDQVLNLNCERLRRARRQTVHHILGWVVPLAQELLADTMATDADRAQIMEMTVRLRLQPNAHGMLKAFWSAWRQYLEPQADTWVAQNQTQF